MANRWRVYSSKNPIPGLQGSWQVEVVVDDSTVVVAMDLFTKGADSNLGNRQKKYVTPFGRRI